MISIKASVNELERSHASLNLAVDCFRGLVADIAGYSVVLDSDLTAPVSAHMTELADRVRNAPAAALPEHSAAARSLLQDHRDKVNEYVCRLRAEQTQTERALTELTAVLAQADDDHDGQIRATVEQLRGISRSPEARAVRYMLKSAAEAIEKSMEQIRREHQAAIARFHKEIRALQRRINASEAEGAFDTLTKVFNRAEIEENLSSEKYTDHLVALIRVRGIPLVAVQFNPAVADQLAAALIVRLRSALPGDSAIARWKEDQFVVFVPRERLGVQPGVLRKNLAESLPGVYSCMDDGKQVRPSVEVTVCTVDGSPKEPPEQTIARIDAASLYI
jgi:GGDEF domain-containing protein